MSRFLPWRPQDTHELDLCDQQARDYGPAGLTEVVDRLANTGRAFTLRCPRGRVLLIAGVVALDPGYGHCWAFQSRHSGPHMLWLTRRVRAYLDILTPKHRRLEMFVRADFPQAAKWAAALGFKPEGIAECAAADGVDMLRFAQINRAALDLERLAA